MTLTTTTAKAAAATVAAIAMTLSLSACGDKEETASGGLSTAATAPGAATADQAAGDTAETVAGEPTEANGEKSDNADKAKDEKKSEEKKDKKSEKTTTKKADNGGNAAAAPVPTLANPFADGQIEAPTYQAISGKEGSEADRKQIEEVVRKILNPESLTTWTRTILDNSCAAVREPAMKEFERQGLTLDSVEQMMKAQEQQGNALDIPKTDVKVSDVRVDGDRASATVTTNTSEGEASQVQLFAKEGGRWKVCNS